MDQTAARSHWPLSSQNSMEDEYEPGAEAYQEASYQAETAEEEEGIGIENTLAPSPPINYNDIPRPRRKRSVKLLQRSYAIKESTSPPPDIPYSRVNSPTIPPMAEPHAIHVVTNNNNSTMHNNNSNATANRPTLKKEGSTQTSDRKVSSTLTRGNSTESQYNDQAGIDIEQFIIETLNKNSKDRTLLLKVETELVNLIKDTKRFSHKFGVMSSYQRLLVHRAAHYFGMEHNVDSSGHMVIVCKSKTTRLPENRFQDFVRDDIVFSTEPRKSILKRDSASFEDTVCFKSPDRHMVDILRRSKSFEEREEEYEKARRRIFHQRQGEQESQDEDDLRWSASPMWTPDNSDATKLHPNSNRPSRLTKVDSYEGKDTLRANSLRSSVSKSFSFGGYDQDPPNSRVLTKQDSGSSVSSRLSPSSSGYKSQSQRSDATMSATPSPTATPNLATQLSNQSGGLSPEPTTDHEEHQQPSVWWAVTSMDSVPPGSFLIDSRTKDFLRNEDGSFYRYDPEHPPKMDAMQFYQNEEFEEECLDEEQPEEDCESELEQDFPTESQDKIPDHRQPTIPSEPMPYNVENPANGEVESSSTSVQPHNTALYHNVQPGPASSQMPQMNAAAPPSYPNPNVVPFGLNPYNMVLPGGGDAGYSMPPGNPQTMMYNIPHQPPTMPTTYDRYPLLEPGSQEFCGYMMGLNLGEVGQAAHRPFYYCCSAPAPPQPPQTSGHFSQGPSSGVPLYLPQQNSQPIRYTSSGFSSYPATERSVSDCSYQPAPPSHAYYRCPSTQVGAPTTSYSSYCSASGAPVGILPMPFATRPQVLGTRAYHHRMSTPPNTQQNGGCPQYPIYSNGYASIPPGCYQPYQTANTPSHLPLASMLRPGMQLGLNGSPPMKGGRGPTYNAARASAVREPGPIDSQQHHSLRIAVPTNQNPIRLLTYTYPGANDLFLANNGNITRSQHYNGAVNSGRGSHSRVRRPRHTTVNGRHVMSLGAASHQQAALATAIEAAGLGVQTPDMTRINHRVHSRRKPKDHLG